MNDFTKALYQKHMSKLLALDQSSRITGWAVFADGVLLEHGKFDAENAGSDVGKRLTYIRNKVSELIRKHEIQHIALEEIQLQNTVGNNVVTYKKLAYVQAVIIELLNTLNLPYTIVASSSWKSTLDIKGRARAEQKRNAQAYVNTTYGIKATQDECDAICIGIHYTRNNSDKGFDWAD